MSKCPVRRTRRIKLTMKEAWAIQKDLIGNTDQIISYVDLANIAADKMGWPKIDKNQPRDKEFAKAYLFKYKNILLGSIDNALVSKCWVYFIQDENLKHVKVGVSDDIESRLKSLQTANPNKLVCIARILCKGRREAYSIEKKIHKLFEKNHLHGEWFHHNVLGHMHQIGIERDSQKRLDKNMDKNDWLFKQVERWKQKGQSSTIPYAKARQNQDNQEELTEATT